VLPCTVMSAEMQIREPAVDKIPSVFFKIRGDLTDIQTFAVGSGIRKLPRLRKPYGRDRWRKRKGVADIELPNGTISKSGASLVGGFRHWKKRIQDQAVRGLIMPARRRKQQGFVVCLRNAGYAASIEVRKLYAFLDDPDAEENDLIRVIDESGDDYVYPARMFQKLVLPP